MPLNAWQTVLALATIWGTLAGMLMWGISRWVSYQRRLDERRAILDQLIQTGETTDEDLMRLIEAWSKDT